MREGVFAVSLLSSASFGGGHDAYHEPNSKPDMHEVCAWLNVASDDGYLDVTFSKTCPLNADASRSRDHALVTAATLQGGVAIKLAVRRVVRSAVTCPAAVCSVCVLLPSKEEYAPPGYRVIGKVGRNQRRFCAATFIANSMFNFIIVTAFKTFNSTQGRVRYKDGIFGVSTPWMYPGIHST